jgi:hypothetical protein
LICRLHRVGPLNQSVLLLEPLLSLLLELSLDELLPLS